MAVLPIGRKEENTGATSQAQHQVWQLLFTTETYMTLLTGHCAGSGCRQRGRQCQWGRAGLRRWAPTGSCSAGSSSGRRGGVRVGTGAGVRIWGRTRFRNNETAPLVPLHVPHTPDRLNLRYWGLPVVPVLEVSLFKDELSPPVAWVHVAHPSGEETRRYIRSIRDPWQGTGSRDVLKIQTNSQLQFLLCRFTS